MINRRVCSTAVIGPAVQMLEAHQQERVPATPPVEVRLDARTVLGGEGSLRRFAPLPAVRRSGWAIARRAAPAGTLCVLL